VASVISKISILPVPSKIISKIYIESSLKCSEMSFINIWTTNYRESNQGKARFRLNYKRFPNSCKKESLKPSNWLKIAIESEKSRKK
jgi:hypothetical protein